MAIQHFFIRARLMLLAWVLSGSFLTLTTSATANGGGWVNEFSFSKAFIENKGQFQLRKSCDDDSDVLFAYHNGGTKIYFTKKGVSFSLTESISYKEQKRREGYQHGDEEFETEEEWIKEEKKERSAIVTRDDISYYWEGANKNVDIIPEGELSEYFSYTFYEGSSVKNENYLKGYEKLIYKELYPNIDVVYEFHPDNGIKYSIIVRPGGDPSQVKMVYSDNFQIQKNDVKIETVFGNITDHAPVTFYQNNPADIIMSRYIANDQTISFRLDNYDPAKTIVIDPWTQTPNFNTNWDCVWECDHDATGNVYIIGGVMPMQLLKYNAAGALQWTYNTPYDTTSWLGTFATDDAGNSYVTLGSTAAIQKINTSGSLVWSNPNPGGIFSSTEFWNISFNCDQTKLVIAGTGGILPPLPYIYDIDVNAGNVINSVQVTQGQLFPTQEVRAITACANAKYYYLTHDSIGYIHQGLTTCLPPNSFPFHVSNGYSLGYKCENWRKNNSGIMAIRYYNGFVYTHRGDQIHKREFITAAIIATANVPGGVFSSTFGSNQVQNSGIDIDECGNVFVGSKTGVVQYDENLNQLATYPTSFPVYDVKVSASGDIIACGSTGNSSSSNRTGSIQSFAVGACDPQPHICCDATICPAGPFCTTDPPVTLTPTTPGGTWSGTGITDPVNGVFDPSVAGQGIHTIIYTIACGSDSTFITVNTCGTIDLCIKSNGDLTASGGDGGPYFWHETDYIEDCSLCFPAFPPIIPPCSLPPGCVTYNLGWSQFTTGITITPPPGTDTIRVTDVSNNEIISYNISSLPPCPVCDPTITAVGPFCESDSFVNLTAVQSGGTWSGNGIINAVNGIFNPSIAGPGSWDIIYDLPCGESDTIGIIVTAYDDATFNYSPATYCLADPDPTPTIAGTNGGMFSISGGGVIDNSTGSVDLDATGQGTFTITYATTGMCPDTQTFDISINSAFDATITPAGPFCENDSAIQLSAVDAGGVWSGNGIIDTAAGIFDPGSAGAGIWKIVYSIAASCGDKDTTTIIIEDAGDASFSYSSGIYCLTDPDPTPNITGTSGGVFSINGSGVINSATGTIDIAATGTGVFTIIYITGGSCPDVDSVNISINTSFDATIAPSGPFCENDTTSILLTAVNPGGIWSGPGITDSINGVFQPAVAGAGTANITYGIIGSCGDTATSSILINAADDAAFNYNPAAYCLTDADPFPNITGTSGGIFSISPGGSIDANTGQVDIGASGEGNYTVTYLTSGACADADTFNISISSSFDATIAPAGPFCDNDPQVILSATDLGGVWMGPGIVDSVSGVFDPAIAGPGVSSIIYNIPGSCGDLDSINITVNPSPSITVPTDTFICQGETVTLTATANQTPIWSTGDTATSIQVSPQDTTSYTAQVSNSCGTASGSVIVAVIQNPVPSIIPDSTSIIPGESITLTASGGTGYLWFPSQGLSCTNCSSPMAAPVVTTMYCANISIGSCTDTACVFIEVIQQKNDFYIPNAFSPNGDGINDFITILGEVAIVDKLEFRIFNRWGEQVYYSDDIDIISNTGGHSNGWDGSYRDEPVDLGTFVYNAKIYLTTGSTVNLKGSITVIK